MSWEELTRLLLQRPAEEKDLLEATWLLTSESFSQEAITSRSKAGFIVGLRGRLRSYFTSWIYNKQVEPLCISRYLEDLRDREREREHNPLIPKRHNQSLVTGTIQHFCNGNLQNYIFISEAALFRIELVFSARCFL